jgi:hypothetical protein
VKRSVTSERPVLGEFRPVVGPNLNASNGSRAVQGRANGNREGRTPSPQGRGANAVWREPAAPAPGRQVEPAALAAKEDEFVYVLSGEVVLVRDGGEEVLCAGVKGGDPNGHCLQNRGTAEATVLEIGSRI